MCAIGNSSFCLPAARVVIRNPPPPISLSLSLSFLVQYKWVPPPLPPRFASIQLCNHRALRGE